MSACICEMKTTIIIYYSICMTFLFSFLLSFFTHRNIWHFFLSSKSHKFHRVSMSTAASTIFFGVKRRRKCARYVRVWLTSVSLPFFFFSRLVSFHFNPHAKPLRICFRFLRRRRRFFSVSLLFSPSIWIIIFSMHNRFSHIIPYCTRTINNTQFL